MYDKQKLEDLKDSLKKWEEENVPLNTICLVARTNDLLKQYEGALKSSDILTHSITGGDTENIDQPGLRLATMHRVKGIEFDYMIIAGVNDEYMPKASLLVEAKTSVERDKIETRERSLLYVSATRARKEVIITNHGKKSKYLN